MMKLYPKFISSFQSGSFMVDSRANGMLSLTTSRISMLVRVVKCELFFRSVRRGFNVGFVNAELYVTTCNSKTCL